MLFDKQFSSIPFLSEEPWLGVRYKSEGRSVILLCSSVSFFFPICIKKKVRPDEIYLERLEHMRCIKESVN